MSSPSWAGRHAIPFRQRCHCFWSSEPLEPRGSQGLCLSVSRVLLLWQWQSGSPSFIRSAWLTLQGSKGWAGQFGI
jgi:hypothetical protein